MSLELSQINEILSVYSDLLLFLAEYSFVLENVSPETQPLKTTHVPVESSLSTQDPARDGTNWYGYAGQNPVTYTDLNGLEQVYFIYTYKNTEYDQKMKSFERNSINDDISRLESKGVSVKVLESATKNRYIECNIR